LEFCRVSHILIAENLRVWKASIFKKVLAKPKVDFYISHVPVALRENGIVVIRSGAVVKTMRLAQTDISLI
jgi:hypothetical protein